MKDFDKNNYSGTPLDSINASLYCGSKCTRKIEGQLANFVLCASYAQDFPNNGGKYIDMHASPLRFHIPSRMDDIQITGMVWYSTMKERKVHMVVNGQPLQNPSTVIDITSHLVVLVKDYFPDEEYMNPHRLFKTCKDWAEFKRAFARSCWNRR